MENDVRLQEAQDALSQCQTLEHRKTACLTEVQSIAGSGMAMAEVRDKVQLLLTEAQACLVQIAHLQEVASRNVDAVLAEQQHNVKALQIRLELFRWTGRSDQALALVAAAAATQPDNPRLQHLCVETLTVEMLTVVKRMLAVSPVPDWAVFLLNWLGQVHPEAQQLSNLRSKTALVEVSSAARQDIVAQAARARASGERDSHQIVFVSEAPRTREMKLAQALMRQGKEVIILYNNAPNYPLESCFSKAIRYEDPWEALRLASMMRPLVFHVFSVFVDPVNMLFVRHKPGTVVFDYCDIFPGLVPGNVRLPENNWQAEALRDADGVCCRDLQYAAAGRLNGWRRNPHVLWFPEYLDSPLQPVPWREHRPLRAVSVGYIQDPSGSFHIATGNIRPLVQRGIHVTIFPHICYRHLPWQEVLRQHAELTDLSKDLVEIHPIVSPGELLRLLPEYDLGLLIAVSDPKFYHPDCFNSGAASRAHEYLEAGLTIVCKKELRLQSFLMGRYGVRIDYQKLVTSTDLEWLPDAVRRSKQRPTTAEAYTLSKNIGRLVGFYERLAHENDIGSGAH